jgi:putative ABC transport system substrate-binding protein
VKRRDLALGLPAAALAGSGWAQNRVRRIGLLVTSAREPQERAAASEALHKSVGAVEGRDFQLLSRAAGGDNARLPALARELVAEGAEIIATTGSASVVALRATTGVPVVGMGVNEATVARMAAEGLRHRLAGIDLHLAPLSLKRLELLASCLPRGARVLMLAEPRHREHPSRKAVEEIAAKLGIELHPSWCSTAADLPAALALARRVKAAGLYQHSSNVLAGLNDEMIALAGQARLADMYEWPDRARRGGLMGYGPNLAELYRQYFALAWRILQGASPASQAIEGPMRVELGLNLGRA